MAPLLRPTAGMHGEMACVNPARHAKQQGKGVIGNGIIQQAGGVGDHDAQLGGRGDIDTVVAHAPAGNDLEFRRFLACQNLCGELIDSRINALHIGQ